MPPNPAFERTGRKRADLIYANSNVIAKIIFDRYGRSLLLWKAAFLATVCAANAPAEPVVGNHSLEW